LNADAAPAATSAAVRETRRAAEALVDRTLGAMATGRGGGERHKASKEEGG